MKNSSTGAVAPIQVTENDIKKFYTDLLEGGDPADWDRKSQTCIRGAIDFHADLNRLKSAQVQVAYAVERLVQARTASRLEENATTVHEKSSP